MDNQTKACVEPNTSMMDDIHQNVAEIRDVSQELLYLMTEKKASIFGQEPEACPATADDGALGTSGGILKNLQLIHADIKDVRAFLMRL